MTIVADCYAVSLDGTPRERGRAHGESLRSIIRTGMGRWKEGLRHSTGQDPDDYLDRFVERTDFMPAITRWAPDLLDEVYGIGEGTDVAFRDIYAYQLMDEEWLFRFTFAGEKGRRELNRCSTLGVLDEGGAPPLLAQNMDLPKVYDGTQTLLRVTHHDRALESFVFTAAGLIGTTGLNSQGVAICTNALAQIGHADRGLPVAFIVRRVLEHLSVEDAVSFVREVPHASGQNYMIGGPGGIVDLECSATKVVSYMSTTTRLYHTNHPLANDDQLGRYDDALGLAFGAGPPATEAPARVLSNSEQRFAFLAQTLDDRSQSITAATAKALLSSCEVPVSVPRTSRHGGMTLGSLVMQLSVPPVLELAPGPPAETAYRRWAFA